MKIILIDEPVTYHNDRPHKCMRQSDIKLSFNLKLIFRTDPIRPHTAVWGRRVAVFSSIVETPSGEK